MGFLEYYLVFCFTTATVVFWRIQRLAARAATHTERAAFWITLFIVDFLFAPLLFLFFVFMHDRFVIATTQNFLERKQNKS